MWFILEIGKWRLRGSFRFLAEELRINHLKFLDKLDLLLIFDWYFFAMQLKMAVGASRRRRWVSFEGDLTGIENGMDV